MIDFLNWKFFRKCSGDSGHARNMRSCLIWIREQIKKRENKEIKNKEIILGKVLLSLVLNYLASPWYESSSAETQPAFNFSETTLNTAE